MRVNFLCASCSKENVYVTGERWEDFRCEHCDAPVHLQVSESITGLGIVDQCILCTKQAFYLQKDFNRRLGCLIITVGAVTSIFTYGISLLAAAAVDWFLFYRLPEVTVCYFCNSIYRGYVPNPKHKPYDLSVGELVEGAIRGEK